MTSIRMTNLFRGQTTRTPIEFVSGTGLLMTLQFQQVVVDQEIDEVFKG